jgi:nitrite reductase/ring-hydroxylating ferredoxin subunit
MTDRTTLNRREWLRRLFLYGTVGTTFAALGGILLDVWLAAGRFSAAHWTDLAPLDLLPADGAVPFPEKRVAVIRRGDRLAALSLECTHLGCLVNTVDQGFFCPCHGSQFGTLGEVWSGPASRPLPWHAVRAREGRLWIHTAGKRPEPDWLELGSVPGRA